MNIFHIYLLTKKEKLFSVGFVHQQSMDCFILTLALFVANLPSLFFLKVDHD